MATTNEELLKQQAATGTQPSRTDQINALYDAQKEAQLNELKGAYEQNLSNAQAARDKLPGQYQQSANDLATQYERNRLNMNRQFSANGINTGAASQAQLSRSNEYLRDFGKLKAAENQAIADADRGINDLTRAYQNSIAAAASENDYKRAAALMDEYNRQEQMDLSKAQTLAGYGDFSMYANLYGADVANNMAALWKAQNPDLAYRTGRINAQEYFNMTGKWPAGYSAPSTWVYKPPSDPPTEPPAEALTFEDARSALIKGWDDTSAGLDEAMAALYKQYGKTMGKDTPTNLTESRASQRSDVSTGKTLPIVSDAGVGAMFDGATSQESKDAIAAALVAGNLTQSGAADLLSAYNAARR